MAAALEGDAAALAAAAEEEALISAPLPTFLHEYSSLAAAEVADSSTPRDAIRVEMEEHRTLLSLRR